MTVDREVFFNTYRSIFGGLNQEQVDSITTLLPYLEQDERVTDSRHFAYMLATAKHETGDTYRPIDEWGKGRGKPYGAPDPQTGKTYYGRGYVQLTWRSNYALFDIEHDPERAKEPALAYRIMSDGMRTGLFTGKKLTDYIADGRCDYFAARRIINGLDRAATVACYAVAFEKILAMSMRG